MQEMQWLKSSLRLRRGQRISSFRTKSERRLPSILTASAGLPRVLWADYKLIQSQMLPAGAVTMTPVNKCEVEFPVKVKGKGQMNILNHCIIINCTHCIVCTFSNLYSGAHSLWHLVKKINKINATLKFSSELLISTWCKSFKSSRLNYKNSL